MEDGCLRYEQRGASLHAGTLCLRLPRSLAPHVEARELALSAQSVRVTVKITFPLLGLLLDYEGIVEVAQ